MYPSGVLELIHLLQIFPHLDKVQITASDLQRLITNRNSIFVFANAGVVGGEAVGQTRTRTLLLQSVTFVRCTAV